MTRRNYTNSSGRCFSDLGGAASVALVRIGDALGLYKTMYERGPLTSVELAAAVGVHERYLREWLSHQAASNYFSYEPATQKFTLPPEQAMVFAIEDSPVFYARHLQLHGLAPRQPTKGRAGVQNRRGGGLGRSSDVPILRGGAVFRPGYHNNLVSNWLPSLNGVVAKLEKGRQSRRCRLRSWGVSTVMMAQAFPNSRFVGYDFHPSSIEHAQAHAREHGVTANTRFEVGTAKDYPEQEF